MFAGATIPPLAFRDPLALGIDERLAMLAAGERRIVYYFDPKESSFRYRAINMLQSLSASPEINVCGTWFTPKDLATADEFIDRADALVLCRAAYSGPIDRMIGRARSRNIPVLFDVDDLVFDTTDVRQVLDLLEHDIEDPAVWSYWCADFGRLGTTLKACDGAIVTTDNLATHISKFAPGMDIVVIPNFLNRAQQSLSRRIFSKKVQSRFARDGRVHIGYFSGTPTHKRDFEVAADVLSKLMELDRRITMRIVGPLEVGALRQFQDRIERYSFQDYLNLQRLIGEVEINIAPLMKHVFTECKSDLKFFEPAIVGTITVASPIPSFRASIQDSHSGFLAEAGQWSSKIGEALALIDRIGDYEAMAIAAYQRAEETYGWDRFGNRVAEAVFRR